MDIRLTPLPDQHQHFLDGATDEHEILSSTSVTLCLYGDPARIADIINAQRPARRLQGRREVSLGLVQYADELLQHLPPERRGAILGMGAVHLLAGVSSLAEICASWAYEDMTTGGALEPFRKFWRCDDRQRATKGVERKLRSPGWIARYVRQNESVLHLRSVARRFLPLCAGEDLRTNAPDVVADLNRQLDAFRVVWAQIERPADYIGAPGYDAPTLASYGEATGTRKPKSLPYRISREDRRITKRAAVMAAAILGASTVGAFARGEPVLLPGKDVSLQVKLGSRLARTGHGTLAVSVVGRESEHLADLCVYFDGTPALDQLTAFALHMGAGLEREVLAKANLIRTSPAAIDHPVFTERLAARGVPAHREGLGIFPSRWQLQRDVQAAYFAATREIWLREMRTVVLGRAARELAALTAERLP